MLEQGGQVLGEPWEGRMPPCSQLAPGLARQERCPKTGVIVDFSDEVAVGLQPRGWAASGWRVVMEPRGRWSPV